MELPQLWDGKKLLQNVVWPAVAGNVAWSFFSVLLTGAWSSGDFYARLVALLFGAIYLGADWLYFEWVGNVRSNYAIWFEGASATLITLFAIAIAQEPARSWVDLVLVAIFLTSTVGLLFGAWGNGKNARAHSTTTLIVLNTIGILWVGLPALGNWWLGWHVSPFLTSASGLAVVIVPWFAHIDARSKNPSV